MKTGRRGAKHGLNNAALSGNDGRSGTRDFVLLRNIATLPVLICEELQGVDLPPRDYSQSHWLRLTALFLSSTEYQWTAADALASSVLGFRMTNGKGIRNRTTRPITQKEF